MKDVLTFILQNITTLPDEVSIEEREEDGGTNYIISVNPADVGRIIGKEGKVIKAIRTIMRVIAIQKGVRVRVSVLSDDNNAPTQVAQDEVIVEEADSSSAPVVADQTPVSDEITVEV